MRIGVTAVVFVIVAALAAESADAHTVARGWKATGSSVQVWFGSYHSFSQNPKFEGSVTLTGLGGGTQPFTTAQAADPVGLDFVEFSSSFWNFGNIDSWQYATFNSLGGGLYTIDISGQNSAKWNKSNFKWPAQFGTKPLPGVPEPVTMTLLGSALAAGFVLRRRRKA